MPRANNTSLVYILRVISRVLSAPRDRLGRLEFVTDEARKAREDLRLAAVFYRVPGCTDVLDQCAKVAAAASGGHYGLTSQINQGEVKKLHGRMFHTRSAT